MAEIVNKKLLFVTDQSRPQILNDHLYQLYKNNLLVDTVVIGNEEPAIKCHSNVISSSSAVLKQYLVNSANQLAQNSHHVEFPEWNYQVLKLYIDYAYTGTVSCTQELMKELYEFADFVEDEQLHSILGKKKRSLFDNSATNEELSMEDQCEQDENASAMPNDLVNGDTGNDVSLDRKKSPKQRTVTDDIDENKIELAEANREEFYEEIMANVEATGPDKMDIEIENAVEDAVEDDAVEGGSTVGRRGSTRKRRKTAKAAETVRSSPRTKNTKKPSGTPQKAKLEETLSPKEPVTIEPEIKDEWQEEIDDDVDDDVDDGEDNPPSTPVRKGRGRPRRSEVTPKVEGKETPKRRKSWTPRGTPKSNTGTPKGTLGKKRKNSLVDPTDEENWFCHKCNCRICMHRPCPFDEEIFMATLEENPEMEYEDLDVKLASPAHDYEEILTARARVLYKQKQIMIKSKGLKLFHCPFCDLFLLYFKNLLEHIAESHADVKMPGQDCPLCPEKFRSNRAYFNHDHSEHQSEGKKGQAGGDVECTVCGVFFHDVKSAKIHEENHANDLELVKARRDSKFSFKLKLNPSSNLVNKVYECPQCKAEIGGEEMYEAHLSQKHGVKSYNCDKCPDRCFGTKNELVLHERSHIGYAPYMCNQCGKRWTTCKKLWTHVSMSHKKGNVLYKCDLCDKEYRSKSNRAAHMNRVHRDYVLPPGEVSEHQCVQCGHFLPNVRMLNIHIRNNHTEHGSRKKCRYCEKYFADHSARRGHEKHIHEGVVDNKTLVKREARKGAQAAVQASRKVFPDRQISVVRSNEAGEREICIVSTGESEAQEVEEIQYEYKIEDGQVVYQTADGSTTLVDVQFETM